MNNKKMQFFVGLIVLVISVFAGAFLTTFIGGKLLDTDENGTEDATQETAFVEEENTTAGHSGNIFDSRYGNRGMKDERLDITDDDITDIVDMINRIGNTRVFGYGFICEINFAFSVHGHVFQQSVPFNGVVDIRFSLFR